MACLTCPNSDGWHRRRIENLEETIGPIAAQEFEQDHPEKEDNCTCGVAVMEGFPIRKSPWDDCPIH